jgi:teichuronic acid biosynthesis glycosyltransferase TuaC
VRLLVYTMLFPNRVQPHHGVFVKERLLRYRERHGAELLVVAPVVRAPPLGPARWRQLADVPAEEELDGVRVVHPRFLAVPAVGDAVRVALMARGSAGALLDEALRFQPTVLDVHYAWPDGAAAQRLRPRLERALHRRVPMVLTARGTDLNLTARDPRRRDEVAAALLGADHVVCVAEALRAVALELGVPPDRVTTLRNGVDVRRFTPGDRAAARAATGLPREGRVLLCVGHLIERKGQHLLLEAYARVFGAPRAGTGATGTAAAADEAPLLVLVGSGEGEGSLRALAARLGLDARVRFAGAVRPEALPQWYRAADALVLPSLREGWPNVVLEALACGTPVLATAIWGTPEILSGCAAGALVPPTVDGLADGLLRLPALRADAARPWAERHTWDATLDGMHAVLQRVSRA